MRTPPVRIGVTGHTNLVDECVPAVADGVRAALAGYGERELVGVTCLARGADQVFARVVLELGGTVEVVLPAEDYRERRVGPDNAAEFDDMLGKAAVVRTMPIAESGSAAYMAASDHVRANADALIAVWDGGPSAGYGGTAEVVAAARDRGLPVTAVWPDGARRR